MDSFMAGTAPGNAGDQELLLLSDYLCERSGIRVPPEKGYLFETRLAKMMVNAGVETFGEFHRYLLSGVDPTATQQLINAMTTNETLWFRDGAPWQVLEREVLPRLVEELRQGRKEKARIWCAAVSTGQEAYSTAMCIDRYLKRNGVSDIPLSRFELLATDISGRVLEIARKGRYDAVSIMRGLSDEYRAAYFRQDGTAWDLDPRIRDAVEFRHFNLQKSFFSLGAFDVVFCRYVLIYFPTELKREVVRKMALALEDSGILFTGNYALYELFEDFFDAARFENLTYYTKKAVRI